MHLDVPLSVDVFFCNVPDGGCAVIRVLWIVCKSYHLQDIVLLGWV